MKKVVSLFLSVVMLISVFAGFGITADAAEEEPQWLFQLITDNTVEVAGLVYSGDRDEVEYIVLPEMIELDGITYQVTAVGTTADDRYENYVFSSFPNLKYVIMPDTITAVDDWAFANCQNLSQVIFSENLKTIGEAAFYNCNNLVGVELPDGLISIGDSAFCSRGLYSVVLPRSVKSIGEAAFGANRSLTRVFYGGSRADWDRINIQGYNDYLTRAPYITYGSSFCEQGSHEGYWTSANNNTFMVCYKCGMLGNVLPFKDLTGYEYYGNFVEYTSLNNSFITGTNPPERTLFSPTTAITRAMFVTILYRMAGEPYYDSNPYSSSPFTDITDTGVYYYDAACWALDEGITNQITFKPYDNVSREQTASFLFRYAEKNGYVTNHDYQNVNLAHYKDYESISFWAAEALQWCAYTGMITGTQQGTANPKGATQRIHATKILYNFGIACEIGNFD